MIKHFDEFLLCRPFVRILSDVVYMYVDSQLVSISHKGLISKSCMNAIAGLYHGSSVNPPVHVVNWFLVHDSNQLLQ